MNSIDRFSTSIVDEKDRSQCFNYGDELRIDRSWHAYAYYNMHIAYVNAIYSKHACYKYSASELYLYTFIYTPITVMYAKGTREVRPAVLVRESNMQLLKYSLDIRVSYSTCLPIFKSQKGSIEALNFLIITSSITS